jgi:drug/metabolite transporter (DMT)-like permease
MSEGKGVFYALLTAVVSGTAVFVNSFGVKGFDPFVYTTLKNVGVVLFLLALFFLFKNFSEFKSISRKNWFLLATIGLIGGSVPFLLFFWGLSTASAASSSFVYRSLFIFATVLAVVFLKEKISGKAILGAGIAFAGNLLLLGGFPEIGFGELLVFLATILWAFEYNLSKKILGAVSPRAVAFGRMFFGSIILISFLAFTGRLFPIASLSIIHWQWVIISTILLTAFVSLWYASLKYSRVSVATAALTLGGPITALLSLLFSNKLPSFTESVGFLLLSFGIILMVGFTALRASFYFLHERWVSWTA